MSEDRKNDLEEYVCKGAMTGAALGFFFVTLLLENGHLYEFTEQLHLSLPNWKVFEFLSLYSPVLGTIFGAAVVGAACFAWKYVDPNGLVKGF